MEERDQGQEVPQRIGIREFRANLAGLLHEAQHGASFLVTSHDQVLAEVRPPPASERQRRKLGAMQGEIWLAPDFDELDPTILATMEGGEG